MYGQPLEKKKDGKIATLAPLPSSSLSIVQGFNILALLFALPTIVWPTKNLQSYALVNTIFQFFPLAYLPLVLVNATTGSRKDANSTADWYTLLGNTSTLVYWISIAIASPTFLQAFKKGGFSNDGMHLLSCDEVGLLSGCAAIVTLDRWYDGASLIRMTDVSLLPFTHVNSVTQP